MSSEEERPATPATPASPKSPQPAQAIPPADPRLKQWVTKGAGGGDADKLSK